MNTISINPPRWTYACVFVTVALSLASLYYRHKVEHRNAAVALAVEGDVAESLGASQGLGFHDSLKSLRSQGFNAVVLSEETVGELVSDGQMQLTSHPAGLGTDTLTIAATGFRRLEDRVEHAIHLRCPQAKLERTPAGLVWEGGPNASLFRTFSLGINPDQARTAAGLGLTIVARCVNPQGASPACVAGTLRWTHDLGATVFLPMGDQTLGRRDALEPFIDALRSLHMLYASPEFGKIGGDAEVLEKAPEVVVRLQSAQAVEIDKMTKAEYVERYVLAGRERDVRVLLLRPFSFSGDTPLSDFGDLGKTVARELEREGGSIKAPHAYDEPNVPKPLFVLLALAIACVATGIVYSFALPAGVQLLASILFVLVGLASWAHPVRPLAALLAAIAFPTLGFMLLERRDGKSILGEYALVSALSIAGGLAVAGMLNEVGYFVRAQQFFGVKAAEFTPLALVAVYFFWKLAETRGLAKNPVLWGQILVGVVIVGALAIMWLRSGNDNPAAVSGFELKFRSLLYRFLVVRPRTKEFLLGHPMMIVGIGLLLRARLSKLPKPRYGGWIALAITGGAIGQTSIVNTMCHLHTPLEVGLTRILVGLVLGGIVGLVVWAIIKRVAPETEG
jgi:hypothetical protein